MRSTTDRGSTGGSERASSLAIRRFGDTYQFELDLPSAGGGLRPTIWSGSRSIDPEVWALLSGALETATAGFESTDFPTMAGTATMVVPSTAGHLEQLGKLIFRYVLPEEVQEELARYSGSLLLATNDPSLPWELTHDGIGFLGVRHAVGRRMVVSRRRRTAEAQAPASGALLIGGPSSAPTDADREIEIVSALLGTAGECTVLRGPQATRSAVSQALLSGAFNIIHYVGQLRFDPEEGGRMGLLLEGDQVLTAADLERVVQGGPLVFVNASSEDDHLAYVGPQTAELAATLADAGARAFVGPAWPVYGGGSRVLATEFYRQLVDGAPLGEALRLARHTVRARLGDALSWSSYVLYGDPGLVAFQGPRASAAVLRPGAPFGPFVLEEEIGRGGMGVVWRAHQPALDRLVALKFLISVHGGDERSRERFRREARIVARLRHPNVLQIHDFGEEGGYLYLVTEYVPGGTLQDLMRRDGRPRPGQAAQLLGPIADALDHLHQNGVVHRDVKPSNILLDARGAAILADCGVARLAEDAGRMTRTGAVVGTPTYMSPEQAAGREVDGRADQYSLGVILYEALTGRVPFEGETPLATALAHLSEAPLSPQSLNPDLDDRVEAALTRALAKAPAERFPTCRAMIEALATGGEGVRTVTAPMGRAVAPAAAPAAGPATYPPRDTATPTPLPATGAGTFSPALTATGPVPMVAAPEVERPAGRSAQLAIVLGVVLLAGLVFGLYQLGWFESEPGATSRTTRPADAPTATVAAVAAQAAAPPATRAAAAEPAAGATAVPTAAPATSTVAPPATARPTTTSVPAAVADWEAVLARLDGGLWSGDLPQAAAVLDTYITKYELQDPPQVGAAREKLYAASIELGKREVEAGQFADAKRRYARALTLRPNDPLAAGEERKVDLWLAGDEASRAGQWEQAASLFRELAAIDATFGKAEEKLLAAQVELAKTWTPTPVPAPVAPAQPAPAPVRPAPSGGSSGGSSGGGGGGAPPPPPLRP